MIDENSQKDTLISDDSGNIDTRDLGNLEIILSWVVVIRLTVLLAIPLFSTLFIDNMWIKILLWIIAFSLFWRSVYAWGHSAISIGLVLLLLYIFFAWESAPGWLAYVIGAVTVIQVGFIRKRIKDIRNIHI